LILNFYQDKQFWLLSFARIEYRIIVSSSTKT